MSFDRYAVITLKSNIFFFMKSVPTQIIKGAATFDDAVNILVKAAPPNTIKGVYIMSKTDFQICRRSVEAVQKAGYTVVGLVEIFRFSISSMIYNLSLNPTDEAIVFVFIGAQSEFVAVIRKCEKGWKLVCVEKRTLDALAEYPSVSDIVYPNDIPDGYESEMEKTFPGRQLHVQTMDRALFFDVFFFNQIYGHSDGHEVLPFCIYNLVFEFEDKKEYIYLNNEVPPFTITKEVVVGDAPIVQIQACDFDITKSTLVRAFKFTSTKFRTVAVTVTVDSALMPQVTLKTIVSRDSNTNDVPLPLLTSDNAASGKKNRSQRRKLARFDAPKNGNADGPAKPTAVTAFNDDEVDTNRPIMTLTKEMDQLKLDPPSPKTVLTFTSDNRVLIEADETYNGDKEILAYVRLRSGKAPEVGQKAFDALKKHPGSVFYGITRLFATDFDPDHPDPSWRFKTTRDADGKVVIRGGNGVITFPIVLFGLVVRSTLLYIQEHVKSEITSLGIRLPSCCLISDTDLKDVSKRIDAELALL